MSAGSNQNAELAALASTWTAGLARPVYLPMSRGELTGLLAAATDRLARAAAAEPADEAAARQQGGALVDADLVAPGVLPATVAALGRHLGGAARSLGGRRPDEGAAAVLAALTDGYLARLRTRILDEQESVRRAEVDARRQAEGALRSSEARFRAIFENAGIGIGIADMTGRIVDANSSFAGMLGYTVAEFRALRVSDFVYPDDAAGMWDLYREIIEGRRDRARVEKRYRHKDGRLVWTNLTASLIRDAAGAPLYTVAMVEDVTARRELQQRLRHQAVHDPLTLLPNRTLVQERLAAAFARSGSRVGVCYLDLDLFKAVNDRLGHDIGDRLLVAVATRLHECVSTRGHLVARMGGDEFVILAEDPAPDELAILADVVLDVLQQPVRVDEHQLAVSASMGVVECDVDAMTPAEVLKAADVTLYWAKSDGRNRWARFDPDRNARDVARYTLSATLLPGLERDEFAVEYQPLVRLADGSVTGVEALVRWAHPTLGRLTPDQFIDLAEETGSIVPLGRRVLTEACEQAAAWNQAHPEADLLVSVNLAVRQAHDPDIVGDVTRVLDKTGLPPRLLQLELTESALLGPAGQPLDALRELAAMGIRIAVDDFGTGYSNLAYLGRLPLHTLKLAGSLVEGLGLPGEQATPDEPIVASLIALAHTLGLTVTAEGVETKLQVERLRALGCDTAQGWHYARSAPWEQVAALLPVTLPALLPPPPR